MSTEKKPRKSGWRPYVGDPTKLSISEGVTLEQWKRWAETATKNLTDSTIQHHSNLEIRATKQ